MVIDSWLADVMAVFAFGFHLTGFILPSQPDSYWESLLYAFVHPFAH